jgi:hypothetical protein
MRRWALASALLLCTACRPDATGSGIYVPFEEGLTLVYENPSLPAGEAREASRFQIRVYKGLMDPRVPGRVELTRNTLHSSETSFFDLEEGGVATVDAQGARGAWLLPKGFPDAVASWSDPKTGLKGRVLGRARWNNDVIRSAVQAHLIDPTGIWVEMEQGGVKRRALYLQGLGEVESQTWSKDHWETVSRLVGRQFTDLPAKNAR